MLLKEKIALYCGMTRSNFCGQNAQILVSKQRLHRRTIVFVVYKNNGGTPYIFSKPSIYDWQTNFHLLLKTEALAKRECKVVSD
jgi:hypothetical protein